MDNSFINRFLSKTPKEKLLTLLLSVAVWGVGILMTLPFFWMISASFKENHTLFSYPIEWIPKEPSLQGYKDVVAGKIPFFRFYLNSLYVSFMAVAGTLLSCAMGGYGYAKIAFPGRDKLFLLKLSTTMIPVTVTMLPTFIIMRSLNLVGTHAALWLPYFFGGAFGIFLMRQHFITLPDDLIDAAKIDGCNQWRIFWKVAMPLSSTPLATLLFLYFTWSWNDYERPLLFLRHNESRFTLPFALKYLADELHINYSGIMAAAILTTLPILILFFVAQRYFTEGLIKTGIKG